MKEHFSKKELIETITPIIENTAMRLGLIPIEIAFEKENNRNFLRIFIYSFSHVVTHLDCEKISRSLGDLLDELIPYKYYLEVSSPGLDRKFKSNKEYIIFNNHNVIIKLKNSIDNISEKTLEAKLINYLENKGIVVLYNSDEIFIPMEKIQYTKLNDKIEINKNKGDNND